MSTFLDKEWLINHGKQIKHRAGKRYTPKLNINLPVAKIFDGLCRTSSFYDVTREHFGLLNRSFSNLKYTNTDLRNFYNNFNKHVVTLIEELGKIKKYNEIPIDWKKINNLSKKANDSAWNFEEKLRELKSEKEKIDKDVDNTRNEIEKINSEIRNIYELQKEIRYFQSFSSSVSSKLSNKPFLFIKGSAGSGKTHLLCDLSEDRIKQSHPTLLLFGEFFSEPDIWMQISTQLNLGSRYNKEKILNKLDEIGRKRKTRSLIIIDALNESSPVSFWKNKIEGIRKDVSKYSNIALVVSMRSGFEREIITKTITKNFTFQEHNGFQFKEWEAVNKFFNEFNIPLPEIPLLTPEFQNPLFLLLFCKAFQGRAKKNTGKKNKQIFRGHEGASFIFETYIDKISKSIENYFNIDHGAGKNIWDTIIEKIAMKMVAKNVDRISEIELKEIVASSHPKINHSNLINALEKNFLLDKIPRYSFEKRQVEGYDYRFPYQKFSDHLIGRFIFKKLRESKQLPKIFFNDDTEIGKFIKETWNRGIIEVLSIQCPEWLNGIEFFEVSPSIDKATVIETFIESIIWRKPTAFSKNTKNIYNFVDKNILTVDYYNNKLLNAFLSVTAVPEHPFNSDFLHKRLSDFSMPERDSWWSVFLHNEFGDQGAIDRLIEWGWSKQNKDNVSDESILLYSTTLTWFLTSSNRYLRDKTTKALVSILTNRLGVILKLLDKFNGINDLYITERLYAVTYGCLLRNNKNKKEIKDIAEWFLNNFFNKKEVLGHILIRDYARGVVECAILNNVLDSSLRPKIIPPYGSVWPKNIPSEEVLREKYYPEKFFKHKTDDRGFLSIWSSVMYDFTKFPGDFGKYVINPNLRYFTGRKIGSENIVRKDLFNKFKSSLTKKQLNLFNKIYSFYGLDSKRLKVIFSMLDKDNTINTKEEIDWEKRDVKEKKRKKSSLLIFRKSLSFDDRILFDKKIKPYLSENGVINDPLDRFDTGVAQRWIFNRVVELGWQPKLHKNFDENVNSQQYDRTEHKAERIGKKYQWIALNEFLSLLADNFEFIGDSMYSKPSIYEGAWQINIRDIDPSCILKDYEKIENDEAADVPSMDSYQPQYNLWEKNKSLKYWLKTKTMPSPKNAIEMTDNKGITWVVLEGFCEWQEKLPPEYEKYKLPTRTLYFMIKSYLVMKKNKDSLFQWCKKQKFFGRWMPESGQFYNIFLGEYPDYPAFIYHNIPYYNHGGWTKNGRGKGTPVKVLVSSDEYLSSGSSVDCSLNDSIKIKLPAKWIVNKMKIGQKYFDGCFYDSHNTLIAFDPSIFIKGVPACLLMRKDKLCSFLKKENCSIIWTISGEKQTIGGNQMGQPHGYQEISGSYCLNNSNRLVGSISSVFNKPEKSKKKKK